MYTSIYQNNRNTLLISYVTSQYDPPLECQQQQGRSGSQVNTSVYQLVHYTHRQQFSHPIIVQVMCVCMNRLCLLLLYISLLFDMPMCVCVCECVCTHVCVSVCVSMCVCEYVFTHVCVCVPWHHVCTLVYHQHIHQSYIVILNSVEHYL